MAVVESNISGLWAAYQPAGKGTIIAGVAATKRFIQVAGDFTINRDDGSENWSDLDRFGDSTDFVNTLVGNGNPTIEAQANETAYLCWFFFGGATVTPKVVATSPPKFEFEPAANTGYWSTWWKRVGAGEIVREKYGDCKIVSIRIEGSSANKIVKIIPTIISLDPGIIYTGADPSAPIDTIDPFVYTEGAAAFEIDGTVFRGHSQFAVVVNDAQAPYYGDDSAPYDLVAGNAAITLEGITVVLDNNSHAIFNNRIYGTPAPVAGTKPIRRVDPLGSYKFNLRRTLDPNGTALALDAVLSMSLWLPSVKWSPDLSIAPNPDGGPVELALAGQMRKNPTGGASPTAPKAMRLTIETGAGDNALYTA